MNSDCGELRPDRKVGLPPICRLMRVPLMQIKPAVPNRTYGAAMSSGRIFS
jgi:hypothetical protein